MENLDHTENAQFLERIQKRAREGDLEAVQDMLRERRSRMKAQMERQWYPWRREDGGTAGDRAPRTPRDPSGQHGATAEPPDA